MKFIIMTDSLSSLQAIHGLKLDNPIVSDIIRYHDTMSRHKDIVYCWIPSHIGISGNEQADALAKSALHRPEVIFPLPQSDLRYCVSTYFAGLWQSVWITNVSNKLLEVQPVIQRHFVPLRSRRDDVVLCRARIGHTYYTHSFLLRGESAPQCIPCDSPLTVKHLLLECADFAHIRSRLYHVNDLRELFANVPAETILQFLRDIGLYFKF